MCPHGGDDQIAWKASFAHDSLRVLVLTQAHELGVPQVIVGGPFEELELADEHRLQPLTFRHLRFRQPLGTPVLRQERQGHLMHQTRQGLHRTGFGEVVNPAREEGAHMHPIAWTLTALDAATE